MAILGCLCSLELELVVNETFFHLQVWGQSDLPHCFWSAGRNCFHHFPFPPMVSTFLRFVISWLSLWTRATTSQFIFHYSGTITRQWTEPMPLPRKCYKKWLREKRTNATCSYAARDSFNWFLPKIIGNSSSELLLGLKNFKRGNSANECVIHPVILSGWSMLINDRNKLRSLLQTLWWFPQVFKLSRIF